MEVAICEEHLLLADVEQFLRKYVVLPTRTALPLALWTLMTYIFDVFDAVPYLAITSPAPRCGKTRLLEVLELIVSTPRRASNISEAALFRMIEKLAPTLLLDEAETLGGKSERAEYLRQIINAGNRRGAVTTRCIGQGTNQDARDFSVFCPKVLAGIGSFPTTITDRSIVISMQRRKNSEPVARFLYRKANPEGQELTARAETVVAASREQISAAYQKVDLDFLSDRDAEAWSPLFAILTVAHPERLMELRACAEHLTGAKALNAEDDSLSLRLLADIRQVWPESEYRIPTAELLSRLRSLEDAPWSEEVPLNPRKLSRMLKPFGIAPAGTVRVGPNTAKGYWREEAETAFARYLVPETPEPSHGSQPV